MARTVRDVLITALEELTGSGFKKFRNKLNDWEIKKGYSKIPKGKLEKADPDDAVDLIRNYYKDDYGAELTLAVLDAINEKQVAEDLKKDLQTVSSSSASLPKEIHFIDKHREALVSRHCNVSGLLDPLLTKELLSYEQYDKIRSKGTSQEQMRELYVCSRSWGKADKDFFYQVLKDINGPLVRDL